MKTPNTGTQKSQGPPVPQKSGPVETGQDASLRAPVGQHLRRASAAGGALCGRHASEACAYSFLCEGLPTGEAPGQMQREKKSHSPIL